MASPGNGHDHQSAQADGKGHRMTLTQKLRLCAQLMGMEAVINYEQIYAVPILQTLGMSVSVAYYTTLVSGPFALFLIPLIGWLVDRGHTPHHRKFVAIVLAAVFQTLGLLTLIAANILHLDYLQDYNTTRNATTVLFTSVDDDSFTDLETDPSVWDLNGNVSSFNEYLNAFAESGNTLTAISEQHHADSTRTHIKAVLGMLGFIFLDVGVDTANGFIKTFMVSCAARAEQTSVIVLGVILGAMGGVTSATLGLIDFTPLLGLGDIEGAKLSIQASAQGVVVILIVLTGLLSTSVTGFQQLRKLQEIQPPKVPSQVHENNTEEDWSKDDDKSRSSSETTEFHGNSKRERSSSDPRKGLSSYHTNQTPNTECARKKSLIDAFESSFSSFESSILVNHSVSVMDNPSNSFADTLPLLENVSQQEDAMDGNYTTSVGYGAVESAWAHEKNSSGKKFLEEDLGSEKNGGGGGGGCRSCLKNPKVRIGFVFITNFFTVGATFTFIFALSDFLGKVVYEGDPSAPPGSDSLNRYQEGMKMASWVLLVYFCTYLVSSIIHPKVLAVLGFRVEFMSLQMVMGLMMLVVVWTSRLEAVFALSVVTGMHRTCYFTMPYAVTNDIAHSIVSKGTGRSPVGLTLALLASSVPLSSTLLYTWLGTVQQLIGDDSAPLWLGSIYCFLGLVAFLFVGKV